ncbi:Respiratory supercomplex factor 1, mitochondrial [Tulasnella sp. 424]|nr:Respiratory supercomplex factor 1, mitochondrial [Tulasnella sp. 424]KAG8971650.1 Respiratory supercomplex factor 1, mitochondrial [Tulasnella sp. 425]
MASQVPVGPPPEGIKEGVDFNTFMQRGWDKCKQQPFVPLGAVVTVWALLGAVREFKRGDSQNVNRYLRFRVVAQGATVAAMLIGSVIYEKSIKEQKEAEEKQERERMLSILDSVGDASSSQPVPAPVVEAAPQPPPLAAPTPASTILPVAEPASVSSASASPESKPKQTRYLGSNDQWREYFNRKNAERAAGSEGASPSTPVPPAPQEPQQQPEKSSGGWFSWRK